MKLAQLRISQAC